ncbi:MAG: hypothetical protein JZD40_00690, partial [Sulfolobus sp.]|nr:hypothetical protein [Sulfolobus sp.]
MALIDEVIYFSVILAILVSTIVGLIAGRGKVKDVKDWVIAGGTFGAVLLWFLMGTEIYTDFTYLGLAGFTYTYGAPVAYNFLTNGLAYMFGFMLLPLIWIFSKKFNVITEADYFEKRYGSKYLGVIVALVGVLALAGYLDLNITAIGIILTSGTGHVTSTQIIEAKIIGFLLVTVFIYVSGIRGSAWNAVIKDILMFSTIFIIFITFPFIFFHGYGNFFHEVTVKIPQYLILPGAKHN